MCEARIPIGALGFFTAWLVGWTAGGVAIAAKNGVDAVLLIALGWGFAAAIAGFSWRVEVERFDRAVTELETQLRNRPKADTPVRREHRSEPRTAG